jgi:VWFA-related protein
MACISPALPCLSLWLAAIAVSAQNAPQPPPIAVSTRLVQVGVIVRDKNGSVADLRKEDFTVLDRGKPQTISIFSTDAAFAAQQPPERPLPPNTFSDLPHYGAVVPRSVTIVLLDNLNTLYSSVAQSKYEHSPYWVEDLALQNAKNHLAAFIKQLSPQDRVAIYGLRHSLYVLCDFTSNRDELLTILRNYDTRPLTNREIVEPGNTMIITGGHDNPRADIFRQGGKFENGASARLASGANDTRSIETMAALEAIAAHVANFPGRKNLVWLTANLPFSGAAMAQVLSPANIAVYPVDARGLLNRSPMVLADIPGTADADDVSGASGHMDNMPAQSSQPIGITTMQELADETGGQAFVNTNDVTGAIRKAVEDSAVTYTLGFYIDRDALDGKFHAIKLEVRGKGLTVRYPKGYFAFPDTAATKNENSTRLVTEVESPIESSAIPLQATIDRVNQPLSHSLTVQCSIDAHHVHLASDGAVRTGAVDVYIIEQDQTGKVLFNSGKTFNLQVPEKQYDALLKSGLLFHEYVQPRAGATTLRILVQDPNTAEVGSLIIPLSQIK